MIDAEFSIYLVFLSELIPDRSERFAVSAPGGVEFDEDILGGVFDKFFKVLTDNDLDSVVGVVWDFFGFQVSSDGAVKNSVDKSSNGVGGEVVLLRGEFGHVLLHVDDAHVGAVLLGDAEEFHNTLVVLDIAVNQNEKELALEFLGGGGVVGLANAAAQHSAQWAHRTAYRVSALRPPVMCLFAYSSWYSIKREAAPGP